MVLPDGDIYLRSEYWLWFQPYCPAIGNLCICVGLPVQGRFNIEHYFDIYFSTWQSTIEQMDILETSIF